MFVLFVLMLFLASKVINVMMASKTMASSAKVSKRIMMVIIVMAKRPTMTSAVTKAMPPSEPASMTPVSVVMPVTFPKVAVSFFGISTAFKTALVDVVIDFVRLVADNHNGNPSDVATLAYLGVHTLNIFEGIGAEQIEHEDIGISISEAVSCKIRDFRLFIEKKFYYVIRAEKQCCQMYFKN